VARVDLGGFSAINDYTWTTSIWINQNDTNGITGRRFVIRSGRQAAI
jgi:hypothetical protein